MHVSVRLQKQTFPAKHKNVFTYVLIFNGVVLEKKIENIFWGNKQIHQSLSIVKFAVLTYSLKKKRYDFDLHSVTNAPVTANNNLHCKVVWLVLQHSFTIRSMCQRALPRLHLC